MKEVLHEQRVLNGEGECSALEMDSDICILKYIIWYRDDWLDSHLQLFKPKAQAVVDLIIHCRMWIVRLRISDYVITKLVYIVYATSYNA